MEGIPNGWNYISHKGRWLSWLEDNYRRLRISIQEFLMTVSWIQQCFNQPHEKTMAFTFTVQHFLFSFISVFQFIWNIPLYVYMKGIKSSIFIITWCEFWNSLPKMNVGVPLTEAVVQEGRLLFYFQRQQLIKNKGWPIQIPQMNN